MNVQEAIHSPSHGKTHAPALPKRHRPMSMLVAQAKSGRSSAFGELYDLHRVRIYHTAFRILRN